MKSKKSKNHLDEQELAEIKDLIVDSAVNDLLHQKIAFTATNVIRLEERWRLEKREDIYYPLMGAISSLYHMLSKRRKELREELKEHHCYLHERTNNLHNRARPPFTNAKGEKVMTKRRLEYQKLNHPDALSDEGGFTYIPPESKED